MLTGMEAVVPIQLPKEVIVEAVIKIDTLTGVTIELEDKLAAHVLLDIVRNNDLLFLNLGTQPIETRGNTTKEG